LTEGIILLDKPPGQTSFQSLGTLKRRLGTGRVGHTGTLDKFAEGLLVVLCGRMTRLCAYATSLDKEYVAVITFGRATTTLDPEGETTAEGNIPGRSSLEEVLPAFVGSLMQVPPAFSAIHVGGRRAYDAARKGESVVLAPRPVRIDRIDLLSYEPPDATIRVSCSKGTYIRSLARDIAEKLGTCGFVSRLQRTRVGGFRLEHARRPEAFDPARDVLPPDAFFDAAPALGRLRVLPQWEGAVCNGRPLAEGFFEQPLGGSSAFPQGMFGAFAVDGRLVAVVERRGEAWRYAAAFPPLAAGGAPL
jgi:tRNA pseudouridine55 synthase